MLVNGLEYSDIELRISPAQIEKFLHELEDKGLHSSIVQGEKMITVNFEDRHQVESLEFRRLGDYYKLRSKNMHISNEQLADLLQRVITSSKGHAIMKTFGPDSIIVHNIQFGEPVRITEISGQKRTVLLDKNGTVTIDEVIKAFKRTDIEKRIPAFKKELDQELARYGQLLKVGDMEQIQVCMQRLEELRKEMLLLEI